MLIHQKHPGLLRSILLIYFISVMLILLFLPTNSLAEEIKSGSRYALCGSTLRTPDARIIKYQQNDSTNQKSIKIQSESAIIKQTDTSIFTGNVE
ncbi:MAG: hypothetical protein ACC657_07225 [Thiohalomonadales bacterium]